MEEEKPKLTLEGKPEEPEKMEITDNEKPLEDKKVPLKKIRLKRAVGGEKAEAREAVLKEMRSKVNAKPEVAEENLQKVLRKTWDNLTKIKGEVSKPLGGVFRTHYFMHLCCLEILLYFICK